MKSENGLFKQEDPSHSFERILIVESYLEWIEAFEEVWEPAPSSKRIVLHAACNLSEFQRQIKAFTFVAVFTNNRIETGFAKGVALCLSLLPEQPDLFANSRDPFLDLVELAQFHFYRDSIEKNEEKMVAVLQTYIATTKS